MLPDNIREGKSLEQLKTMKGIEGLTNLLKINPKVKFEFPIFFIFFIEFFKKCEKTYFFKFYE